MDPPAIAPAALEAHGDNIIIVALSYGGPVVDADAAAVVPRARRVARSYQRELEAPLRQAREGISLNCSRGAPPRATTKIGAFSSLRFVERLLGVVEEVRDRRTVRHARRARVLAAHQLLVIRLHVMAGSAATSP